MRKSILLNVNCLKVILLTVMNTIQANLIHPFALTRLSTGPTQYTNNQWDASFIKKFITAKWPYELYKGSILQDFLLVLSSML